MSTEARILFSFLAVLILGLAAWTLRPMQARSVSPARFKLGERDPFFYLLFHPSGRPRAWAWCVPLTVAAVSVVVVWLLPGG